MSGAPFQLMIPDDVPQIWTEAKLNAQNTSHDVQCAKMGVPLGTKLNVELVVDMPDYPMFVAYHEWAQEQPRFPIPLMLSSREQWKNKRPEELSTTLASLYHQGKPAPIMALVWHRACS